jgi:exopolyphosphatase / guanosine-5'-triphosphate,3'-diphosphate pyrophosphatase
MRTAAIDIGSNSTRLLVAETDGRAITSEIVRETTITRLGQDVRRTGRLDPAAIRRTLEVLRTYRQAIDRHRPAAISAVATSAVREAENAGELLGKATALLGAEPKTLTGDEEARLTFLGALSDPVTQKLGARFLVIDIGGGSTEIAIGPAGGPTLSKSLPLGCVSLVEAYVKTDPPTSAELTAIRQYVRERLSKELDRGSGRGAIPIAVAGTTTSLAAIEMGLDPYDPEKVHRYRLTVSTTERLLGELASIPLASRRLVSGLQPDRAESILPGAVVLSECLDYFRLDHVIVSERDILDGAALAAAVNLTQ